MEGSTSVDGPDSNHSATLDFLAARGGPRTLVGLGAGSSARGALFFFETACFFLGCFEVEGPGLGWSRDSSKLSTKAKMQKISIYPPDM